MAAQDDVAAAAEQLAAVLAELDDPESDLTATTATRRRIEGAVFALRALSDGRPGV